MDAFQFYEEVGKGRYTVVYKGRRRKTIEYVAIKCVEKHQLAEVSVRRQWSWCACEQTCLAGVSELPFLGLKFRGHFPLRRHRQVQQEVAVMHSLNHVNVVRFLNWYSTKGHVWVVVEFCAGGSLDLVLRQDRSLPPPAVKVPSPRRVLLAKCV